MSKLTLNLDPTLSKEIKDGIDKGELETLKKRLSGIDDGDHVDGLLSLDRMTLIPESSEDNIIPRIISSEALLASGAVGTSKKIKQPKINTITPDNNIPKPTPEDISSQGTSSAPIVTPDSDIDLLLNIWKKSVKNSEFLAIYNAHKLALAPFLPLKLELQLLASYRDLRQITNKHGRLSSEDTKIKELISPHN